MTNLYDFLREIKGRANSRPINAAPLGTDAYLVPITPAELDWLESFLQPADHEIHFKGKKQPGGDPENPVVAQDFMIAGAEVDIFCLLTEVMLQNSTFASLVLGAAKFFQEHVPTCPECKQQVLEAATREVTAWIFSPHKPLK